MQEQRKASNTTTSEIVLESLREQIINGTLQPQEKPRWQRFWLVSGNRYQGKSD